MTGSCPVVLAYAAFSTLAHAVAVAVGVFVRELVSDDVAVDEGEAVVDGVKLGVTDGDGVLLEDNVAVPVSEMEAPAEGDGDAVNDAEGVNEADWLGLAVVDGVLLGVGVEVGQVDSHELESS